MFPSFIICGIEHSGTTLLSDLFRQHPDYDSGFEVGGLLAKDPRAFRTMEPFITNLCSGWGVASTDLDYICEVDDFEGFYSRLWERSTVIQKSRPKMFDKTPRYLAKLPKVVERAQCPVLLCYKDPRSIVGSDFKRAKVKDFDSWYEGYVEPKKRYMQSLYTNYERAVKGEITDVLPVALESLCLDARRTLEGVFEFIGEKFSLSYLNLQDLRYKHTKAPYIATNVPFEYLLTLTNAQQERVERDFGGSKQWFY